MSALEKMQSWWKALHPWQKLAFCCWGALVAAVTLRASLVNPARGSVFPVYASAASDWAHGGDLYTLDFLRPCYRYHPLVAAFFVPWQVLPEKVDAILWRWLGLALLLLGLREWSKHLAGRWIDPATLSIFTLLVFPFALQSFNNAQANTHLIALLLLGLAACQGGRWWLGASLVTAATILKLYPIAVGMLLMVGFPRQFAGRYLLCMAAAFAAPFLTQSPSYVSSQYDLWIRYLQHDDRHALLLDEASRDAYSMIQAWTMPPSLRAYQVVVVLIGGAFAAIILSGVLRGASRRGLLTTTLHLGCVWMTAFGPSTESCTYTILGPTLAILLVDPERGRSRLSWFFAILGYLLVVSPVFGTMIGKGRILQQIGVQPAGAILVLIPILEDFARSLRHRAGQNLTHPDRLQVDQQPRAAA